MAIEEIEISCPVIKKMREAKKLKQMPQGSCREAFPKTMP
jgi:hypothetical protein